MNSKVQQVIRFVAVLSFVSMLSMLIKIIPFDNTMIVIDIVFIVIWGLSEIDMYKNKKNS
ncbi:hypothetical protein [Citrobacter braakii]|uniref:hypothetical protein n=1 Tax=Citrobacter braakii TaxID=57706 RepID=UPI002B3877BD|nr:hypothetical protein [Citrobacter braakii]MEB0946946.1 hypothetical protein [Citrobacter braakii]MEB0972183.1 hypothetical protein [Citrobacter braakii]MEB0996550.1 hypothetical protein [Citrobacter braakii]MEB1012192.1 hypothetical protein [Citrobacter braakii]